MATAHSTSKGRSGRNRLHSGAGRRKTVGAPPNTAHRQMMPDLADQGRSVRIRGALREFLESEREFLLKAQSLLLCIAQAMGDARHPVTGPYYPDVVELASDLVRRRAVNLDELLLDGRLPHCAGGKSPIL